MSKNSLELRGDQENPRRISASEFHKLPRPEVSTTDPLYSGKDIVYSGTPFVEVLKAGGLFASLRVIAKQPFPRNVVS
jgi:hypothetical protein